jgi:hypothetical protein
MATREQLHKDVDALPEPQVSKARIVVEDFEDSDDAADMALIPDAWKTFEDGTSAPNWAAAVRRSREAH